MPDLPLTGDARDLHVVMSRMLYLSDEKAAIDYYCMKISRIFDKAERASDTPQAVDQQLRDADSRSEIESAIFAIQSRGANAAAVVQYIRDARDRDEFPSINDAIRARESVLKFEASKLDGRVGFNLSFDTVKKNWHIFRPVAHLWAAFFANHTLPHIRNEALEGHELMCVDLRWFLAIAEDYRHFGESEEWERSGRGRFTAPLFYSEAMWRVPSTYALPIVKRSPPGALAATFPPPTS